MGIMIMRRQAEKRIWILGILLFTTICAYITFAWITDLRGIETYTEVVKPEEIIIGGGNAEEIESIDLGNIDIENSNQFQYFVFSVIGKEGTGTYDLQLSHTTNLPFTYEIYKAQSDSSGDISYFTIENNTEYKYSLEGPETPLDGGYINKAAGVADDSRRIQSYQSYNLVQKNAYPLHWLKEDISVRDTTNDEDDKFIDYYVLKVSWDEDIVIDKETDILYLIAEVS